MPDVLWFLISLFKLPAAPGRGIIPLAFHKHNSPTTTKETLH